MEPFMFGLFKKTDKIKRTGPVKKQAETTSKDVAARKKPGQTTEFKGKVLRSKLEVVEAIKNADKQRALDAIVILSDLAAQAIYEHDLRAMIIINTAIDEINHHIDVKLRSTGEPEDLTKDMDETRMYMMIRLTMLPVCSMMNALQRFSSTGMDEVNNEIDARIGQIRQFVMEHEKAP
jgi:hypothetical protein